MNSMQDLGGIQGFGPVYREQNEPPFHYEWERRVMALFPALFADGIFNVDEFRHAMERMQPLNLLGGTYYEHWLHAYDTLLVEKGVVTKGELQSGKAAPGSAKKTPVLTTEIAGPLLSGGASARRPLEEGTQARFKIGDKVRSMLRHPSGHTRQPRYTRGRVGTIAADHGVFITPDTEAHGGGEHPQHVYSVEFTAQELWGKGASLADKVRVDLWDSYLEEA